MAEKRYYWLKLKEDFFQQLEIKKLRKIAGGDTYTIIFLKLQLLSLKTDGLLEFVGIEEDFAEELALTIDEDIDNVKFVLLYLKKIGWLKEEAENIYSLPNTIENIGSETSAAKRMRTLRNKPVTELRSSVTLLQNCSTDIDIEKDIDKEIEKSESNNKPNGSKSKSSKPAVRHKYGEYNNVLLSDEDMEKLKSEIPNYEDYINKLSSYMASTGKSYKNHLATMRNWFRKDKQEKNDNSNNSMPDYESKGFWEC